MKAMILAAGFGTRLRPITDRIPKALVEFDSVSLLEYQIKKLLHYDIHEMVINIHHHAAKICRFLEEHKNFGARIHLSYEDPVLETGGGVKQASQYLEDDDFILINVDIITDLKLEKLISFHQKQKPLASLFISDRPSGRCFLFDDHNFLKGWKNKSTGESIIPGESNQKLSEFAFNGIHIISPRIFELFGAERIFSIRDTYLELCAHYPIIGCKAQHDHWLDVGHIDELETHKRLIYKNSLMKKYY